MSDHNGPSNVVWLDHRRRTGAQDNLVCLEAELTNERQMLAMLRANNADVGDLERCIEMTKAMLAIARALSRSQIPMYDDPLQL